MMQKRYVLLDRDGTIITERHYLSDPHDVELLPGALEGMRLLQSHGLGLAIITNQSAIARGYLTPSRLDEIHERLRVLLGEGGVTIAGIFCCPHHPEERCVCRKPAPGLISQATAELGFDPRQCFVIGDKECDIELGRQIGATTVLVETGYGRQTWRDRKAWPNFVSADLIGAAHIISGVMGMNLPTAKSQTHERLFSGAAERMRRHLIASIETKRRLMDECENDILTAAAFLADSIGNGHKIMLCGNGGSAADSQHIAAEFVSVLSQDFLRPGLPALSLATDTSLLTGNVNDFGFDGVFARQVQALGQAGDVLIGISTSGNSANVVNALLYAAEHSLSTIGMTGGSGGKIGEIADVCIRVPSRCVQHIQESHITIGHILCDLVERTLFQDKEFSI